MSRKEWKQLKRTQRLFVKIQERLRARHKGHVVAIELESGRYVVGMNELDAARRALAAFPGKIFNFFRVGYPAVHKFRSVKTCA